MFCQCSLADGVYGFPFLPYLLEATIVILACLTRLPNLKQIYRGTVDKAIEMLKKLYRKTWVSGKVARMIFKLGSIIPSVFAGCESTLLSISRTKHGHGEGDSTGNNSAFTPGQSLIQIHDSMGRSCHPPPVTHHDYALDNWNTDIRDSISSSFSQSYPEIGPDSQDGSSDHLVGLDFRIEDFPFESNFGNMEPQPSLPPGNSTMDGGDMTDRFAGQSLDGYDMEWLQELIAHDGRLTGFA